MAGARQPQKANETTFKKGDGKVKGRPKGTVNKTTALQKATIETVMNSLEETIIEDLKAVNASRRYYLKSIDLDIAWARSQIEDSTMKITINNWE